MSGKRKTAYFYYPVFIEPDGNRTPAPPSFWGDLHRHLATLPAHQRRFVHYGREYRGRARTEASPAQEFFYLGRVRAGSDFPDVTTAPGADESDVLVVDGDLLEPVYFRSVSGSSPNIVLLRTSGGPSVSAIEAWIAHVLQLDGTNRRFEFAPLLRPDAHAKLNTAVGVARIDVKVDPAERLGVQEYSGADSIPAAIDAVVEDTGELATVAIQVSFGRQTPPQGEAGSLLGQMASLLRMGGLKKAQATLLMPGDDGAVLRDKVDFIKDRVTAKVPLGESDEERPTPAVVLLALAEAVRQYRG